MGDRDILSSFYGSICEYFVGKCGKGKCYLVKKQKEHLQTDGDFSITLNIKAQEKHASKFRLNSEYSLCNPYECDKVTVPTGIDECNSGKVSQNIVESSEKWSLKIDHCSLHHERLCLFLNKSHAFETILHCILSQGSLYGRFSDNLKKILFTADSVLEDEWMMDMTDYRRNLVKCVIENILSETGHLIISEEDMCNEDIHYHVSSKPVKNFTGVHVFCGAVTDSQKKCKEREVLAKDYLRQKCEELREMSRHKHGPQVDNNTKWEKFFRNIGEATLRIELLNIRPSRNVNLNFQEDSSETSRSAHFILYNCARLAALQEKFDQNCSEKIYPPLIPLEKVNCSLLAKEEEWELLSNYLLMYPNVLQSTIEFIDKGKPMPNLLCQFLYSLCGCYSSYYRRVRVLTEPRDHMLPVMYARLYLLKAVEYVLHNGLRLLGIEPIRYM